MWCKSTACLPGALAADIGTTAAALPLISVALGVAGLVLILIVVMAMKLPAMRRTHEQHVTFVRQLTTTMHERNGAMGLFGLDLAPV